MAANIFISVCMTLCVISRVSAVPPAFNFPTANQNFAPAQFASPSSLPSLPQLPLPGTTSQPSLQQFSLADLTALLSGTNTNFLQGLAPATLSTSSTGLAASATSFAPTSFQPAASSFRSGTNTNFLPGLAPGPAASATSFAPTSFAPTSFAPTSFAPTSFAPTSFAPTSFLPAASSFPSPMSSFPSPMSSFPSASSVPSLPSSFQPLPPPSNSWIPPPTTVAKPTLYYDKSSPQVRAILMVIAAGNLDVNMSPIDLTKGEQMKPEFLKINPLHTVPTMTDGDLTLTDSHAISIYLTEKYMGDNSPLWPQGALRYKVLNRMLYSAATFYRRLNDVVSVIFTPGTKRAQVAAQIPKIKEQYDVLETFLGQSTFMAANQLTLADISISTVLSTCNILLPVSPNTWPKLANWFNQMKSMPFYQNGNAEGLALMKRGLSQATDYPLNPLA